MSDQAIEQEIQAKGLTAPRITPQDLENNIVSEFYLTGGDAVVVSDTPVDEITAEVRERLDLLTLCILVLQNGCTVVGESSPVSAENFDEEVGRRVARQKAMDKVWPLMGYALLEQKKQNSRK